MTEGETVNEINFSDAGKARTDSNALTDIGGTLTSIDVALFVAWLEEAEPALAASVIPAATTGEGLAPFLVGLCQKLRKQRFQQAVFFVAVVVALVGAFIVVTQPIEFVTSDLGL